MKKLIYFIIPILVFPFLAFAGICEVKVTYHLTTGGVEKESFFPKASNKKECEKKAKPYKANLTPNKTKEKIVSVDWRE